MEKQESFDFPDEPRVTRTTQPTAQRKIVRESTSLCRYCGQRVPGWCMARTPALGDDAGWTAIRPYHGPGCTWIVTRGLKTDAEAVPQHGAQAPEAAKHPDA